MSERKMYVLCRKDLQSAAYQAVQSCHAVAEYCLKNPETKWSNGTMVVLGVDTEKDLIQWHEKLRKIDPYVTLFYEPDIDSCTAACLVIEGRSPLRHLPLL